MSFSFSTVPTKLGADWVLTRDGLRDNISNEVVLCARQLQFWQAYAISHFRVFEATGNAVNLIQARVGWESYLHVDAVVRSWPAFQVAAGSLNELRLRSKFELARCLFWIGKRNEKEKALKLALDILQDVCVHPHGSLESEIITPPDLVELEVQLLMLSSMIYFEQELFDKSCTQLERLLDKPSQQTYTDIEVRFTLALVLLKRYEQSFVAGRVYQNDDPVTSTFLRTAMQLLKQCYRAIELWPAVGFYHGYLKRSEAKHLLANEQVGSFLVHHSLDNSAEDKSRKHNKQSTENMLLQVKLSEEPLRIASMHIEFTNTGVYKTRKMPLPLGQFSLHGLIARFPSEAGVQIKLGIRKSLYCPSLMEKIKQVQPEFLRAKAATRSRLLDWSEWERKLREMVVPQFSDSGSQWTRRNETWSTVCFEVAKALERSEAWVFAEFAACEALRCSKDRSHRANVHFLAGRVTINMQKRSESVLFMQLASIEKSRKGSHFTDNLAAVQQALSLNVSLSKQESFTCRLERIQKLERLCLKAWRYDSLASRFRGDPFREALLLQRIADESYAVCGDTFFFRSLLRAHISAYVAKNSWHDSLHLKCAYESVTRLFERFHKHPELWPTHLVNLTVHLGEKAPPRLIGTKNRAFNVKLLLISWHHMPFLVCFEMAEVLYRYKIHSYSTLIDVYESLLGRLRGSQPQTPVYASYEELILLRIAFLHAAKASQAEHSWRHLQTAVSTINEILEQRRIRTRLFKGEFMLRQTKRIKWPCSIRFPFLFSDAEVIFLRGHFVQLQEDMMRISAERRSSWQDFYPLHEELVGIMTKSASHVKAYNSGGRMLNSVRYRTENLRGIKIFVGATHDVVVSNVLLSQPFVAIRLEGKTISTRTPPTWTNLSPSWEEDIEIPVSSSRAVITISVMNRTRQNSRWQDDDTIGYVSIPIRELLAAHEGVTEGKYYELTLLKAYNQRPSSESERYRDKVARIFLGFQVIVNPQPLLPPSAKHTAAWATQIGSWDVEDVRAHLHGDLQVFVSNRWIWSRFARLFMQDGDMFVAKWFFTKSVRLTPELQRRTSKVAVRLSSPDSLAIVRDLIGLSCCYQANQTDSRWGELATPLLVQAEAIVVRKISQSKQDYCALSDRTKLDKHLVVVRELLADARGNPTRVGPLAEALSRRTPATSEWIKVIDRRASGSISTRYFNQDTGETFQSRWRVEPLEYEDRAAVMVEEQKRLPHRIIIMNSEMRARVVFHRQAMLRHHAEDPFQWIAVFNDRKKEYQFFSTHSAKAYISPHASRYPGHPPTYVMLADGFLLYHVLLVQDAYRKFHCRRQRQRRLRGVYMSLCLVFCELVAARRRILRRSLNCVRVIVEKAECLRAADLLTSDPFVVLTLTDFAGSIVNTGKTSVKYNTLNPKWNEEFRFRYSFTAEEAKRIAFQSDDHTYVGEAALTLKVFDHDMAIRQNVGGRKLKFVDESSTQDPNPSEVFLEQSSDDFLGMVRIPIQPFVHGKSMTADLLLLDDQGGNNSPRARGFLTVTVQWAHCDDEEDEVPNETKLWAIGSGGGRTLITKKAQGRPELTGEAAREIDQLREMMECLLQLHLTIATEVLDPMCRLHKRIEIAQTKGKTAEEAKMLEQRFDGLLHSQLLPRLQGARDLIARGIDVQLPVVLKKLFGPIEEYLSSFGQSSRRELRSSMEKCLDELNSTIYLLKMVPSDSITPVDAINMALNQHHQVNIWNDQLRQILGTFFTGEKAQWHFSLEESVHAAYWKLTDHGINGAPHLRRGEEKTVERPATAVAEAKRKERIERAKQEKAWYEL
ncbi:unnamed protein product [Phytophthora fragariaefolia]|uniref:Unnamed protein product n=1 Tax=Phytophthora fragariaefolia TaxID=1490495 RepID=A0A9W7CXB0_9STRA|nr:unnamed protein product [Phytophthora fragariaefolia]